MCYKPLNLINPKLKTENESSQFDKNNDRLFVQVPCGYCGECKQQKMNDYYVRTYAQYKDTVVDKHGFCMIQTLTFREDTVPEFHGLKCFDSTYIRRFQKNLRNLLRNRFGKDSYEHLKMFIVSEYGSITARPHHHLLAFVEIPGCTPEVFDECINKAWDYGFTQTNQPFDSHGKPNKYFEHPELCVVTSNDAIQYVAKYVNKDFDFLVCLNKQTKNSEFVQWFQHERYVKYCLENLGYSSDTNIDDILDYDQQLETAYQMDKIMSETQFNMFYPFKEISYQMLFKVLSRKDFNRFLPFNRMSQGYGVALKDYDIEALSKGRILLPDNEQGLKEYKLPMYIDRKVFYNYDKETKCFSLNDLGKKMKVVRSELNTDYIVKQMSTFFSHWYTNIRKELVDEIFAHIRLQIESSIQDVDDLSDFVSDCLDGRDWKEYANYILVYKNMLLPKENVLYFDSSVSANYDIVHNLCIPDYVDKFHVPYGDKKLFHHFISDMSSQLCNCHYEFRGFETISNLYNLIRDKLSSEKQIEYLQKQKLLSEQKLFNIHYKGKL